MNNKIRFAITCFIFSTKGFTQNPAKIYANKYSELESLSKNKMVNLFESDSLVLYNDGSFKKYYLYGFHDEIIDNIILGKWKKTENRLILKPEFQLNYKDEIIRDYKGSHSEIIFEVKRSNKIRYKGNWPNRKIRKLEKK